MNGILRPYHTESKLSTVQNKSEKDNQRLFGHKTIIGNWNKGLKSPRNQNLYNTGQIRSESEIVQAQDIIGQNDWTWTLTEVSPIYPYPWNLRPHHTIILPQGHGNQLSIFLVWINSAQSWNFNMNEITGNSEVSLLGMTDLDYEVIRVEWQRETMITNSKPFPLRGLWRHRHQGTHLC